MQSSMLWGKINIFLCGQHVSPLLINVDSGYHEPLLLEHFSVPRSFRMNSKFLNTVYRAFCLLLQPDFLTSSLLSSWTGLLSGHQMAIFNRCSDVLWSPPHIFLTINNDTGSWQ